MAAVLSGGEGAVASHLSAAALWCLDGVDERILEVSVTSGRVIRGVIAHRRPGRDEVAVAIVDGIPVTPVDRTLLELAGVESGRRAGAALDDALRRGLVTLKEMRALMPRGTRDRRRGAAAVRQLFDAHDERSYLVGSALEADLRGLLHAHGLPPPAGQHEVIDGGRTLPGSTSRTTSRGSASRWTGTGGTRATVSGGSGTFAARTG